jgi:hypothetical protein
MNSKSGDVVGDVAAILAADKEIEEALGRNPHEVTMEQATALLVQPASEVKGAQKTTKKKQAQEEHEGDNDKQADKYDAQQASIVDAEGIWGDMAFKNNANEEQVQELLAEELVQCESEGNGMRQDMIKYIETDKPMQLTCKVCKQRGTLEGAEGWYCQTCADDYIIQIPKDQEVTENDMDISPEDMTYDTDMTHGNNTQLGPEQAACSEASKSKASTKQSPEEIAGFKLKEIVHTHTREGNKEDGTYAADYFVGEIKEFRRCPCATMVTSHSTACDPSCACRAIQGKYRAVQCRWMA